MKGVFPSQAPCFQLHDARRRNLIAFSFKPLSVSWIPRMYVRMCTGRSGKLSTFPKCRSGAASRLGLRAAWSRCVTKCGWVLSLDSSWGLIISLKDTLYTGMSVLCRNGLSAEWVVNNWRIQASYSLDKVHNAAVKVRLQDFEMM